MKSIVIIANCIMMIMTHTQFLALSHSAWMMLISWQWDFNYEFMQVRLILLTYSLNRSDRPRFPLIAWWALHSAAFESWPVRYVCLCHTFIHWSWLSYRRAHFSWNHLVGWFFFLLHLFNIWPQPFLRIMQMATKKKKKSDREKEAKRQYKSSEEERKMLTTPWGFPFHCYAHLLVMHIWLYIIVIIIIVDLLLTIERRYDNDNDTRDIYELTRSRFNLLTILCANVKPIYL